MACKICIFLLGIITAWIQCNTVGFALAGGLRERSPKDWMGQRMIHCEWKPAWMQGTKPWRSSGANQESADAVDRHLRGKSRAAVQTFPSPSTRSCCCSSYWTRSCGVPLQSVPSLNHSPLVWDQRGSLLFRIWSDFSVNWSDFFHFCAVDLLVVLSCLQMPLACSQSWSPQGPRSSIV